MLGPLDPSTLAAPVQKMLGAPPKMQEMAARGIAPGIRPGDLVVLLVALAQSANEAAKTAAQKTLDALPEPVLTGALGGDLHPHAIDALATRYHARVEVLEKLLSNPAIHDETIEAVCRVASEQAAELLATNEERLLRHPRFIELLYLNKNTRMSTADRMVELAVRNNVEVNLPAWKEAAALIKDELIMDASEEASPDDLLFRETLDIGDQLRAEGRSEDDDTHDALEDGQEIVKEKFIPLHRRIAAMTNSQKVRAAMVGDHEEIMLLVRDSNRMVAMAAAKSPQLSEADAEKIASNRSVASDVLGIVGHNPEFLKRYTIKKALVDNPKTPVMVSMNLIKHLREADLRLLEKSKNVSGPVRDAIKHHLSRRKN
jgi:hypothetical protein